MNLEAFEYSISVTVNGSYLKYKFQGPQTLPDVFIEITNSGVNPSYVNGLLTPNIEAILKQVLKLSEPFLVGNKVSNYEIDLKTLYKV